MGMRQAGIFGFVVFLWTLHRHEPSCAQDIAGTLLVESVRANLGEDGVCDAQVSRT